MIKLNLAAILLIACLNANAIELVCTPITDSEFDKVFTVRFDIDNKKSAKLIEDIWDGDLIYSRCRGDFSGGCMISVKKTDLKTIKEDEAYLIYQSNQVNNFVTTYSLNKNNGRMKKTDWKEVAAEKKPNEVFKFKNEVTKTKFEVFTTIDYLCK